MTKPLSRFENEHNAHLDTTARRVELLYNSAVTEAAKLAKLGKYDPNRPFRFSDFPATSARLQKMLLTLSDGLRVLIEKNTAVARERSNQKNDSLVEGVFSDSDVSPARLLPYMSRNLNALTAFQARVVGGMNLSERVWKYTGQFKTEIEMGIDVGLRNGTSAAKLAEKLQRYLREPDRLFEEVRNERGQIVLTQAMRDYRPGRGIYRSSYKNALRLTRTEINMAYRTADHERWQQLTFVVGIEVKRSNSPYPCVVCESGKGKYPKDFLFRGFHPNCRCYAVPILATPDELSRLNRAIIENEEPETFVSENTVTTVPTGFSNYVSQNRERFANSPSKPFFLSENKQYLPVASSLPIPAPQPVAISRLFDTMQRLRYSSYDAAEVIDRVYGELIPGFDLGRFDGSLSELCQANGLSLASAQINTTSGSAGLRMKWEGFDKKRNPFTLERTFFRDDAGRLTVEHNLFVLPESIQGGGFSKKLFQSLYTEYRAANVEIMSVHANIDVGGYAWARYGFSFRNQADRRMVYNKAMRNLSGKDLKDFEEVWATLNAETRFDMQTFSRQKWAKDVLLKSDWYGTIDLTVARQREQFEDYLFGRK